MMEAFALYLLKSVIWLSGFALVYLLFLRNERFFLLNRFFLVSGILISFFFPLITVHYNVEIPAISKIEGGNAMLTGVRYAGHSNIFNMESLLLALYLSGVLFVSFRIIKQSTDVLSSIKKTGIIETHPVKLIRNADYNISFSFFSYVFVNPSVTELETKEIVNHELVHIRQKHWVDLVLVELLSILQWFNPLIWIYIRFIRQNHEYLADEVALQRTSDPALYRATLLNQLAGYPVVSLANSFNYSLNKKRFKMMKNIVSSPWRKMKIILILPVFAIVLYAFAKPEYSYNSVKGSPETKNPALKVQNQIVKGTVVQEDGTPLPGASMIVKGTTIGTTTDLNGSFVLDRLPSDAELIVSFIGFQSKVIKPGKNSSEMKITMIKSTVNIEEVKIVPPPPPPPPLQVQLSRENMKAPLIILDGKVTDIDINTIPVETVESVNVLPGKEATVKYGATDKDGVILITTKKGGVQISDVPPPPPPPLPGSNGRVSIVEEQKSTDKAAFVVVEEMPSFPGGDGALLKYITANTNYPETAKEKNIQGKVIIRFCIKPDGGVSMASVLKGVSPELDAEAMRVVNSLPAFRPGTQGGKAVPVWYMVPIAFSLK